MDRENHSRLDDRIAGHEEESVGHEDKKEQVTLHSGQMREERDDRCRQDMHQTSPAFPPPIAQMAEERVADDGRQEDTAQRNTRFLYRKPVRVLQKERAEAAHAAAGEIAQTEGQRRRDKQDRRRRSAEHFLGLWSLVRCGNHGRCVFGEPVEQRCANNAEEAQFQYRRAPVAGLSGAPAGVNRTD